MTKKRGVKFEKALDELEQLVDSMEEGDLSLEESLKAFEKGVKLSRECQEALQVAEQKIQVLMGQSDDGGWVVDSLDGDTLEQEGADDIDD